MGMISVRNCTSADDVRAAALAAAERRARLYGSPVPVRLVPPTPPMAPRKWRPELDAHVKDYRRERARGDVYAAIHCQGEDKPQPAIFARSASAVFGFDWFDIKGPSRMYPVVLARQKIMWLMRRYYPEKASYPYIAKMMGRTDHSCAFNAIKKIDRLIASNDPSVSDLKGWVSE